MEPAICSHKRSKLGYIQWQKWATEQNKKGIRQKRCPHCKLYMFPSEF